MNKEISNINNKKNTHNRNPKLACAVSKSAITAPGYSHDKEQYILGLPPFAVTYQLIVVHLQM